MVEVQKNQKSHFWTKQIFKLLFVLVSPVSAFCKIPKSLIKETGYCAQFAPIVPPGATIGATTGHLWCSPPAPLRLLQSRDSCLGSREIPCPTTNAGIPLILPDHLADHENTAAGVCCEYTLMYFNKLKWTII